CDAWWRCYLAISRYWLPCLCTSHAHRVANYARQHLSLSGRTRRRSRPYQALPEVDWSDNGLCIRYLLWPEFALDQFLFAEYSAHDLLADWDHQCFEFTRQHGRSCCRYRLDRFLFSCPEFCQYESIERSHDADDFHGGSPRVSRLQLESSIYFH